MNTLETIIKMLQDAERAATMQSMSLGFPAERVQVVYSDGAVQKSVHPTDYVRGVTKLYRESWIIPQIRKAITMLEANAELLHRTEALAEVLRQSNLARIHDLARSSMGERP